MRLKSRSLFFLILFSSTISSVSLALDVYSNTYGDVDGYFHNRTGLKHLEKEPRMAISEFLKALENDPMNANIHMNLGLALLAAEQPEQAIKAFKSARTLAKDPNQRFESSYNVGVVAGQMGDVETALRYYQDALEVHPDSQEVKTNIELLFKGQKDQQNKDGQGQGDPKKDPSKGGEGDQDKDQQQQPKDPQQQKPAPKKQPQQFKSQELTPNDVKKILEELKSQEQGIRAKEYEKGKKERSGGKDW